MADQSPELPSGSPEDHYARLMAWYDGQARKTMIGYWVLSIVELVAAATMTVLAATAVIPWLTAAFGALVTLMIALKGLFKLPDTYIGYRAAAEAIRVEGELYASRTAPYDVIDEPSCRRLFVERLVSIQRREGEGWLAMVRPQPTT